MLSVVPEPPDRDQRPLVATGSAPCSGATERTGRPSSGPGEGDHPANERPADTRPPRRTAQMRPFVSPVPWVDAEAALGFPPDHPYVRRYWTAVLGWGAIADLLRLVTAARRALPLRRPVHLPQLIREGLVAVTLTETRVRTTIPPLTAAHVRRLPPALRREHARLRFEGSHRPPD